jgi:hypothetical protein
VAEYVSVSFLKAAPNNSVADDASSASEMWTPGAGNFVSSVLSTSELCILRVTATQNILVSIGVAPNALADAGRFLLPADQIEWRAVRPGHKVAAALA